MFKSLDNSYSFILLFNREDISSIINSMRLEESIVFSLPTLVLEISYQHSLENILLDSSVIEIKIDTNLNNNTNKSIPKSYYNKNKITFILISYSLEIDKGIYNYTLSCLITYPEFYSIATESYNSSVSSIFNRIAKQLNLETDIDNNILDNQIWLRNNTTLLDFLRDYVKHSYINDISAMSWCLDRDLVLKLKDISKIATSKDYKWKLVKTNDNKNNSILYTEIAHSDETGDLEMNYGDYGSKDYNFAIKTSDYINDNRPIKVLTSYKKICLDQNIQSAQLYDYNIGVCNVHKNYYRAEDQNDRILSTYSNIKVVENIGIIKNIQMFDLVSIESPNMNINELKKQELGLYIVSGIDTMITQEHFTRRVYLTRNWK